MIRKSRLSRGKPPKRSSKPIPRSNPKRRKGSFARCYHSKERVIWVQSLPCVACKLVGYSDNAHIKRDGMGRKAGYEFIVPLCGARQNDYGSWGFAGHHHVLDRVLGREKFEETYGLDLDAEARRTQELWKLHQQENQK